MNTAVKKGTKYTFVLVFFLALFLLTGCINRTYKVEIWNYGGVVTFRAEVLAEVPHSTNINPELDVVPF